jgi:hypothetical protein
MSAITFDGLEFGRAPHSPRPDVLRDERGAVMVMGLLFACFLAGALWYVIGIGDVILFRDRMQEAADAAAFSAAVVHARGMNFIVICNLLLFVLTAFYSVIAIVTDIVESVQFFVGLPDSFECGNDCTFSDQLVLCPLVEKASAINAGSALFCGPGSACKGFCSIPDILIIPIPGSLCADSVFVPYIGPALAAGCCVVADFVDPIEDLVADNVFPTYFKFIQNVMPAIATTEHVTAQWLAPWGAEAVAVQTASQYGQAGAMLSLSLIPDAAIGGIVGHGGLADVTSEETDPNYQFSLQKIGLPVYSLRMRALCGKVVTYPFDWLGSVLGGGVVSGVLNVVLGLISSVFADHYCKQPEGSEEIDGQPFWYSEGAKDIYGPASNGSDWMQVWSFIMFAEKKDTERTIVGLASHKPSQAVNLTPAPVPQWYSAEAEFFFDCHGNFNDDACNGNGAAWNAQGGFSMYIPHWRTRLRRVHAPSFFSDLINVGISGIFTIDNQGAISNGVKSVLAPITGELGSLGGSAITTASQVAVGQIGTEVTNAGTTIGTAIDGNGVVNTTIH